MRGVWHRWCRYSFRIERDRVDAGTVQLFAQPRHGVSGAVTGALPVRNRERLPDGSGPNINSVEIEAMCIDGQTVGRHGEVLDLPLGRDESFWLGGRTRVRSVHSDHRI